MNTGNGQPTLIRYGSGSTSVCRLLVAVSERGVCGLHFLDGGEPRALAELRRQFPKAELVKDQPAADGVLKQVEQMIAGRREKLDLPLDMHGTPFQLRCWREMQRVPRGKTWSYSDLARRAGNPKAVRAAASACAKNPVAIVVPCHRILRRGGALGGYGGGLERKQALLYREANG